MQDCVPLARAAVSEAALEAVDRIALRKDQRRTYDIIIWHLDQTLAGRNPPPLHMLLHGEGGTGKSKVIQTVTEGFKARGPQYMLTKAAYTGVAASLINGKTTQGSHHIGMKHSLPLRQKRSCNNFGSINITLCLMNILC